MNIKIRRTVFSVFVGLLVLLVGVCSASCSMNNIALLGPGMSDWTYKLPYDYEIEHINANMIVLSNKDREIVVNNSIELFKESENYICLMCKNNNMETDTVTEYNNVFYLLKFSSGELVGPMDITECNYQIELLEDEEFSGWIKTNPAPEGAEFPT